MTLGDFSKRALLTGAGFSRNWNGLLASEFFGRLISKTAIASNLKLRNLLLNEINFEAALNTAKTSGFSAEYVELLENAILDVFIEHDHAIERTGYFSNEDIHMYGVEKFLARFYGKDSGYLFTLNQDLLLERKFINYGTYPPYPPRPSLPGIEPQPQWFSSIFGDLDPNGLPPDYIRNIDSAFFSPSPLVKQFNYIKLHGSFDWRDKSGTELLVIGGGKADVIEKSPILKWYSEVFRSVCMDGDVRLFISGYGFADEHINEILALGIREARLRVFIHNTMEPAAMLERLKKMPYGEDIWSGLLGYSVRQLVEIFPGNQRYTQELENLESTIFG